jgi:hypothetical protein
MNISYDDAVNNLVTYTKGRSIEKGIDIVIDGDIKAPPALVSLSMLDRKPSIEDKVNFVYGLLLGNHITVKLYGEQLASFTVNEGMSLEAIEVFKVTPAIFSYFIEAVYGVFLKNCYPQLSESQKAEKAKREGQALAQAQQN